LKDKLNKHMMEIRKLFGMQGSQDGGVALGEEEGNLESLANGEEVDSTIANARLIDQIMKLKLLINENRRALEGDDDDLEKADIGSDE